MGGNFGEPFQSVAAKQFAVFRFGRGDDRAERRFVWGGHAEFLVREAKIESGFGDFHRDIEPSLEGTPEIGWVLACNAHGKGYATEAVRAIVAWGDAHFGAKPTACIIAPENLLSIRVAGKNGYREIQRTTYHGNPTIMFQRGGSKA